MSVWKEGTLISIKGGWGNRLSLPPVRFWWIGSFIIKRHLVFWFLIIKTTQSPVRVSSIPLMCLKRRNLDINQGWAGEPTVFASRPILMNRFFHYHKTFSLLILDNQDHSITSSSLVNTANVSDKKGTLKSIKGGLGWDCLSYRPTDSHESVPSLSVVVCSTQALSILGKGLVWILSGARHHSNNAPLV